MSSKYVGAPEPPCAAMKAAYQACLKERQRWRRANKLTKGTARYNVVGPYVEEDGRVMVGCIAQGVSRAQAESVARRSSLERSEFLVGYNPDLAAAMRRATHVVPAGACPAPRHAGGEFDLSWHGTPIDMYAPGASKRARKLPMLSGARLARARLVLGRR